MNKQHEFVCLAILSCILVIMVTLSTSLLVSTKIYADESEVIDDINILVPASCSVEGIIATGEDHTATVQNNQYTSEIGTTTFDTYCNDNGGYSIYAVGYSNDEYGNTYMKHNSDSTFDFNTGIATSGNTSDWAMKLTAISGAYAPTIQSDANGTFSSYHVVPSTLTKVASYTSNTDMPATGVNATGSRFTSTYAVWISSTQVAGIYTGKVKYVLVHPADATPAQPVACASGKICYNANTNKAVGGMGRQTANAETEITLLASNFSREGYGFAGWNTEYDYSGTFYGPNETITTPSDMSSGLPLYAVWIESEGKMQDWNGCNSLTTATYSGNSEDETDWSILQTMNSLTALTDIRDNQTYAVARLSDGKCWMIENLRLDAENSSGEGAAQGFGGVFKGLAEYETSNFSNVTTANSLYKTDTDTESSAPNIIDAASHTASDTDYSGYAFPRYNNNNTRARASSPTVNTGSTYSFGNYYTWASAKANTGHYSAAAASNSATTSICPHAWRLPTGVGSGDYGKLSNSLGGYKNGSNVAQSMSDTTVPTAATMGMRFRAFPNNFVYSGRYNSTSASQRGTYAYYWTATARASGTAYALRFYSTGFNPGNTYPSKYIGYNVRCVIGS